MHLVKNWYPQTGMILGYLAAGELVRPKHVYEFFLTKGVFSPWRSTWVKSMLDHHVGVEIR